MANVMQKTEPVKKAVKKEKPIKERRWFSSFENALYQSGWQLTSNQHSYVVFKDGDTRREIRINPDMITYECGTTYVSLPIAVLSAFMSLLHQLRLADFSDMLDMCYAGGAPAKTTLFPPAFVDHEDNHHRFTPENSLPCLPH